MKKECKFKRCHCGTMYHPGVGLCPNCKAPNMDVCVTCGDGIK